MCEVIQVDKNILGGVPTFRGTRVPIKTFFDYIEGGETIIEFMDDFPTVDKQDILKLLESFKSDIIPKKVA